MHCTSCAAAIPDTARFCPACGTENAALRSNRAAAPHVPSVASTNPTAKMGGCSFLLLVIGVLYVAARLTGGDTPAAPAALTDPKAIAAKAKACDDGVAALFKAGVAKARPAADRLEVDEIAWGELPAEQKRIFTAGLRCSALGGTDSSDPTEGATVEGYHSGKTLAIATSAGVTLN